MGVLVTRVEVIIKTPRERCADTGNLLEVGRTGAQHALQAAEMPQQSAALRGAQARHRLEHRLVIAARAPAAVTADREAVRFIADPLYEARGGRMRLEHEWRIPAVYKQSFLARAALGALGDADERDIFEPKRHQHRMHFVDLPQAAIDEQEIR